MDINEMMAQMRQAMRRRAVAGFVQEGLDPEVAERLLEITAHGENGAVFTDEAFEDPTVIGQGFTYGDLRVVETALTFILNDALAKTAQTCAEAAERGVPVSAAINFDLMSQRMRVFLQAWDHLHELVVAISEPVVPDSIEGWD